MGASHIRLFSQPELLDSAGDGFSSSFRGSKRGHLEPASGYERSGWVFGATAAAALYRREMLDDVGFLDEAFFFNCEDVDLYLRAQLRGWKAWYEASAQLKHHVSASHGLLGTRSIYYWSRNCEMVWIKGVPAALVWRFLPQKLLQELWSLITLAHDPRRVWAFIQGKAAVLPLLPRLLRQRREIQRGRRISVAELEAQMHKVLSKANVAAKLAGLPAQWRRDRLAAAKAAGEGRGR